MSGRVVTVTHLPEAKPKRWEALAQYLRSSRVIPPGDFTGELKINFRSGGISSVTKTEVVR